MRKFSKLSYTFYSKKSEIVANTVTIVVIVNRVVVLVVEVVVVLLKYQVLDAKLINVWCLFAMCFN